MAKLGSFFRRLFSPSFFDDRNSSSSSSTTIPSTSKLTKLTTQSCTSSPRIVVKQTTLNAESTNNAIKSNYLSSDINKANIRRLSAPLIIHSSIHHPPQYPSTIVNENTEEALLSSLQRSSLSSSTTTAHPNHSIHSLANSSGGGSSLGSPLSRSDVRSASFNLSTSPSMTSNTLANNISSTSGR
jgi:hypothetical protein